MRGQTRTTKEELMTHLTEEMMQDVPSATSVRVFFCHNPECKRPHVVLMALDGSPFAQFVMPDPHPDGSGFFKDLQGAMYRSAVERGDKS